MKFKIRFAEQIVGVFLLTAMIILIGILFLMGSNQRWFSKNYHFSSRFKSGENISVGMPISLKGFKIGEVDGIKLLPDNSVEVDFYIFDSYYDKVTENSILDLSISPLGLGSGGINFYPGHNQTILPELSFLPSLDFKEGRELVEKGLVDKPSNGGAIPGIINNIAPLIEQTSETMRGLNEFVETTNKTIIGNDQKII